MAAQEYPGKGLSLSQLAFALNEELKRNAYSSLYVAADHSPARGDFTTRRAHSPHRFTFEDVSRLDKDVSTALANIREWRNSFIPINRVPLDILSLVPTHLVAQKDIFRATFVCRHWRRTFLQHGVLWSDLLLSKGEAYVKTLLTRAKGSPLDITAATNDPAGAIAALPPYTQQIRSIYFSFAHWNDIQKISEVNSGPLPLLTKLIIYVYDEFGLGTLDSMTPPSIPLFTNAPNVREFILNSERFPFLAHFVFPNLTTFNLSATPSAKFRLEYRALELLDFLEASPRLQTVSIKLIAGTINLHGLLPHRVVVLPDLNTFYLSFDDGEFGYQLATHISCPSAKRTLLTLDRPNDNLVPPVMFPPPPSWNVLSRQYSTVPIKDVVLTIGADQDQVRIISCSLHFRSSNAVLFGLEFNLLRSEDDDEEQVVPYGDLHRATFCQAATTIRDHPLLPTVKLLYIHHRCFIHSFNNLRHLANEFGGLLKSLGPLDRLFIYGCDPHVYLTPFLSLPELNNTEEPTMYPPIKELVICHPTMVHHKEECMSAIVEFAKSQHARGLPFERLELLMERLPEGIAERLRPWVGILECYEEPCPEDF